MSARGCGGRFRDQKGAVLLKPAAETADALPPLAPMTAVLILAHQSPELLGRLVRRLESYGTACLIHVDAKVDIAPFEKACSSTSAVFIRPRTKVTWGGFSIVEATISLLEAALPDSRFTHFLLISGDAYPVKPRGQFRYLIARPFDQISGGVIRPDSETYKRISCTYFPDTLVPFAPDGRGKTHAQPDATKKAAMRVRQAYQMKKSGFPWRYSKGGQWWSLTRETVERCMEVIKSQPELVEWFTCSLVPDEAFFQTIIENFGPSRTGAGMPVFTLWDPRSTAHPLVFTDSSDLERLRRTICPLARKFSLNNGTLLLDLLDCWMDENDDLAYCKPAETSSLSPWTGSRDTRQEGWGANGENLPWDAGFFTAWERDPWWMVDLLDEFRVERVAIVNRVNQPERFRTFAILSSLDNKTWTTRLMQTDPIDVSSDPEAPWQVEFAEPFPARYVRIVLLGSGYLHLRRVQIFGRRSSGSDHPPDHRSAVRHDLALCKPALTSSVSPWTPWQDSSQDARGANSVSLAEDFGFFTEREREPWWMVDLLGEYAIEEVAIVNRPCYPQRFRTFAIVSSLDAEVWKTRFAQTAPIDVSSDPQTPLRIRFAEPYPARYLRIVLLGVEYLHLRRVQAFGRPLTGPCDLAERPAGERPDLAYCKPARSSSVSLWTPWQNPEHDARGANGATLAEDFGFFTNQEREPWWMVDLLAEYAVQEIAIVNRLNQPQRFQTFSILSSLDSRTWTTRFTQAVPINVSSDPELPWRLPFSEPFTARYVRIMLLGTGYLHLRRVQIFGHSVSNLNFSD